MFYAAVRPCEKKPGAPGFISLLSWLTLIQELKGDGARGSSSDDGDVDRDCLIL